ncbi:general stress protein [Streptosporangium sandarakinum]|uniref:general stress protein n=1 Tax=Streptosporangium sandarakinum TaxID=1260955 RepID=UPI0033B0403B
MRPAETPPAAREPVANYRTYAEAQRAVDYLSDQKFPVENTSIVGVDLRLVEKVLGRLTYLRATGMGAASGAWIGLLVGLFLAIFVPGRFGLLLILWGLIWGVIAGAIFGLVGHALTGGRRDFISSSELVADHYEVLATAPHVAEARRVLESMSPGGTPMGTMPPGSATPGGTVPPPATGGPGTMPPGAHGAPGTMPPGAVPPRP